MMADTFPLQLHTQPHAWRVYAGRKRDPAFEKFQHKVFERDHYTCQYCGFQAKEYMEVLNADNNYRNSKLSNMITACCFCAQCMFIDSINHNEFGGGTIIYLPEMTQAELNGLCHVLFCAIANATSYRADAQSIYRNLKFRAQIIEQSLGEGMSNPMKLGRSLVEANVPDRPKHAKELLKNLRLLPSRSKFEKQISTWAEAALEELSTQ